jgi:hypothetical protein
MSNGVTAPNPAVGAKAPTRPMPKDRAKAATRLTLTSMVQTLTPRTNPSTATDRVMAPTHPVLNGAEA